ncbi:hypothetical protein CKO28_14745 [Rhodovibrio sodomensis]|uniref:Uncharacterized protein n=1 Tax=Rhodovibrio sodomensis TaxID=1088 RepID=A0ABS1DHS4_9PROT|nr:hypothetical protein [Rhodovibrio sodomensis]MBK1669293.1 hypothetical protein [Rhodovibrio sodomensis]
MSEYQYYEFVAVDRPLGEADQAALRALSSRARITGTSFTNYYEWGDFKGDPVALMQRWFNLHLYLANWGTRRLMMRLPARSLDPARLEPFLQEVDWVDVETFGEDFLVDFLQEDEEPDADFDDGSGWLAALAPLRADLLSGYLRVFYLVWLSAVAQGLLPDETPEPLPGIGPLSGALDAFAAFFGIDADLVAVAAERDAVDRPPSGDAARMQVAALPEEEKTDLLVRLVEGDPHAGCALRARLRDDDAGAAAVRRTVGELRRRAQARAEERARAAAERRAAEQRRQAEAAERARRARLDALRQRGASAWRDVEAEIARRNAAAYDRAATLLADLKTVAAEDGTLDAYARRLEDLRARHARKPKLLARLDRLRAG